jgi:hypothetical protein
MGCIQLALTDKTKADALRSVLARSAQVEVVCLEAPDLDRACVVVVDREHLEMLPAPLASPEKVVLIARNDPAALKWAWDAGVSSVVFWRLVFERERRVQG